MNQKIIVNGVELEIDVIITILRADKKIEAINLVHKTSKSSLREAKVAVDRIEADHVNNTFDVKTKKHYSNSMFNEPKRKKYGVFVVIGVVLALMAYFIYNHFS